MGEVEKNTRETREIVTRARSADALTSVRFIDTDFYADLRYSEIRRQLQLEQRTAEIDERWISRRAARDDNAGFFFGFSRCRVELLKLIDSCYSLVYP